MIDFMFNRHAKWLSICNQLSWREEVSSLNVLIASTVWRQDHNSPKWLGTAFPRGFSSRQPQAQPLFDIPPA